MKISRRFFEGMIFTDFMHLWITRSKLDDVQSRLSSQHAEEKRNFFEKFQSEKDKEMEAARTGWQNQIKELTAMVIQLTLFASVGNTVTGLTMT